MAEAMKLYSVDFTPMWPVGGCLIILAENIIVAEKITRETIKHTNEFTIEEISMEQSKVVVYKSGDY